MGEPDDFEAFARQAEAALRRLAFARTGDWQAAEDIAQDVLADAFRRWADLVHYDDPLAWARRAVLNRSVSRWRGVTSEARALVRLGSRRAARDDGPVLSDEDLWAALRDLPRRQLEVTLLLWFEDLPVADVAATLGCGPETVRTHWRRARTSLARSLEVDLTSDPVPSSPIEVPPITSTDPSGGSR